MSDGRGFWRVLLAACALLIAYGSLYPFEFVEPRSVARAWHRLLGYRLWWTSAGDTAGNVALFVPFGALLVAALPAASRRPSRLALLGLLAVAFALALQVAQLWLPSRSAALADALWNGVGTVLGMLGALALAKRGQRRGGRLPREAWLPVALLAVWVLAQLAPFVPTLDWQAIKNSVKPLFIDPTIEPLRVLLVAAPLLAVGLLISALPGGSSRVTAGRLALLLAAALAARLFIVGRSITPSSLLGFAAGYAGWAVLDRLEPRRRHGIALLLLVAAYSIAALLPFEWRSTPARMHWLPFEAMLHGAMQINAWVLVESIFIYGALLWLAQRSGIAVPPASVLLSLWVGALELLQLWIVGRTADITAPLLVLAAGMVIHRLSPPLTTPPPPAARNTARSRG